MFKIPICRLYYLVIYIKVLKEIIYIIIKKQQSLLCWDARVVKGVHLRCTDASLTGSNPVPSKEDFMMIMSTLPSQGRILL